MVCTIHKLGGQQMSHDDIIALIDNSVKRFYRILITFEDCEESGNLKPFGAYVKRLMYQFSGMFSLLGIDGFYEIAGILEGMLVKLNDLSHDDVKALSFHCIDVLNKARE
jgi:hypothetical protein